MDNTVVSVATEIILDLDNDSSLSSSFVQSWLIGNVGKLNNAIGSAIEIVTVATVSEFSPLPTDDQKDIFKWLFQCQYFSNLAKNSLGAAAFDWISLSEGDSSVKRVSKNDLAKSYSELLKQCRASLNEMIKHYRMNWALPRSKSAYDSNAYLYSRLSD